VQGVVYACSSRMHAILLIAPRSPSIASNVILMYLEFVVPPSLTSTPFLSTAYVISTSGGVVSSTVSQSAETVSPSPGLKSSTKSSGASEHLKVSAPGPPL
jgi:hypothetical protein